MNAWLTKLVDLRDAGTDAMLVTVAATRGSAPREVGAKMIVTARETFGTIGGGQLEYRCARLAFDALASGERAVRFRKFALGSGLGQCCGGVVEILFEHVAAGACEWLDELEMFYAERRPVVMVTTASQKLLVSDGYLYPERAAGDTAVLLTNAQEILRDCRGATTLRLAEGGIALYEPLRDSDFHIAVFGAGHVGAAVVDVLSRLDCRIRWIDSRRGMLPESPPPGVLPIETESPVDEVGALPAGAYYLVLTHSHPLDYEICGRVLARDDFAWCGLIGSRSKRRRFEKLMRQQGMSGQRLDRLTCPIGVDGIAGKRPAEIAIAVAAQMLRVRDAGTGSGTVYLIGNRGQLPSTS